MLPKSDPHLVHAGLPFGEDGLARSIFGRGDDGRFERGIVEERFCQLAAAFTAVLPSSKEDMQHMCTVNAVPQRAK